MKKEVLMEKGVLMKEAWARRKMSLLEKVLMTKVPLMTTKSTLESQSGPSRMS
jgi:hypothetical protein